MFVHTYVTTRRQLFSQSGLIEPNFDCNYPFSVDLAPNGIVLGAKSIGKGVITLQIWLRSTRFRKEFSARIYYFIRDDVISNKILSMHSPNEI